MRGHYAIKIIRPGVEAFFSTDAVVSGWVGGSFTEEKWGKVDNAMRFVTPQAAGDFIKAYNLPDCRPVGICAKCTKVYGLQAPVKPGYPPHNPTPDFCSDICMRNRHD